MKTDSINKNHLITKNLHLYGQIRIAQYTLKGLENLIMKQKIMNLRQSLTLRM